MKIPFTKAHGARNDFLLTWRDRLPPELLVALGAEPIVLPAWDPMGSLAH